MLCFLCFLSMVCPAAGGALCLLVLPAWLAGVPTVLCIPQQPVLHICRYTHYRACTPSAAHTFQGLFLRLLRENCCACVCAYTEGDCILARFAARVCVLWGEEGASWPPPPACCVPCVLVVKWSCFWDTLGVEGGLDHHLYIHDHRPVMVNQMCYESGWIVFQGTAPLCTVMMKL